MKKRKHELSKIQREKIIFISRLKYAEVKIISICLDVNKIYEGDDYDKKFEVLSTLKNKKLKINNTLFNIYKIMIENPFFEQNHWFKTGKVFTKSDKTKLA